MQAATVRVNRNRTHASRPMPLKRSRFWLVCLLFLIWSLVIAGRLFWLQVVRHGEYVERAHKQQQRSIEVPPRRGSLYDRNLHALAMTVRVDSLYAVPADIEDKQAAAHALAPLVHTDPDDDQTTEDGIMARLLSGHSSIRIARGLSADLAQRVTALGLKGLYIEKEFERFYPDNQIAAQVLGYVGADDNGLGGLEEKFEKQLHGVPGHMNKAMDARRHVMGSSESDPIPGQNLQLTIDENIQFLAERALDRAMAKEHAENGTVVVQDVHTGQILALAIRPTFDPNNARHATPDLLRNHAVSDVYEPGSTFKLIAYSAALDQHLADPNEIIDCLGGKITIAGRVIHDDQSDHYGKIPLHKALEVSSDVAAIKLAMRVGQDRYYQYVRDFGFGSRTGIEMPGETRGLLRPVSRWGPSSIGSVAMGQEVAVTPLQLVTMVSTIANGGVYLPPHVLMPGQLKQATGTPMTGDPFKPGEELPDPLPAGAHRVISTLAAAEMRKMMEGVVLFGTGTEAQLNGYSSAGKTGTAQKVDPRTHRYSRTMHIASFAGFAPVNNPVIAIAVVMDSPKGDYYGTTAAAPVFANVAQPVLEYLGVPHDIEVEQAPELETAKAKSRLKEDANDRDGDGEGLYAEASDVPADDAASGAASAATPAPKEIAAPAPQVTSVPVEHADAAKRDSSSEKSSAAPKPPAEVVVASKTAVRVPSLVGLPLRKVIEQAAAAGFQVAISGSGTAREQTPAAGTMVEPGTRIRVRCGR